MRSAAVLDACVLFSKTLTDALLYPAEVDAFVPFWSASIREEWVRNLRAHQIKQGKAPDRVDARARAMDDAFPGSCIPTERVDAFMPAARAIPEAYGRLHPGDAHVAAAAMAIGADMIVTTNTGHFPERVSWKGRLILRMTPDEFLTQVIREIPDIVIAGYQRQLATTRTGARSMDDIVQGLSKPHMAPTAARALALAMSKRVK
jgi:hypothetical protein